MSRLTATLVTHPSKNLQKASEKLCEHFLGLGRNAPSPHKYHLAASEQQVNFIATMERKQLPVDQQLPSIMAKRVEENRNKLKAIVCAVILCGRQGIELHGHRDDWKHFDDTPHANHGNSVALLHFAVESGDRVLAEHLQSAGRNPSIPATQYRTS